MSDDPSSDEAKVSFLSQAVAYERGFFFGKAQGVPLAIDYTLSSIKARREFLLTGRLNLILYGHVPSGIGISVGNADDDQGPGFPISFDLPPPPENDKPSG